MKPVLAWVKSNPLIVACLVLIALILPGSYVASSAWGRKVRGEQEAKANKELTAVKSALVDYALPSFEPGVPPVTFKAEPNARLTEWFKEHRDRLTSQAAEIVTRAVNFNKGVGEDARRVLRTEHRPLVEGLFGVEATRAAEEVVRRARGGEAFDQMDPQERAKEVRAALAELVKPKLYEMEDKLLGKRGNPDPYRRLLDSLNAGEPADPIRLAQVIGDIEAREREKITQGKRDLTPEEAATLRKALTERRLGEYQSRAREVSVYATKGVFPTDTRTGVSIATDPLDAREIEPTRLFLYQWDLWTLADMLSGVRLANAGPDGRLRRVAEAPVKRVIGIRLQPPEGLFAGGQDEINEAVFGVRTPTASTPGMVPTDPMLSITGRGMGPWNQVYDVRRGTIELVVASARLGEVLQAFERANFITITDMDLASVDVWDDLRNGYFYGEDHVMKVTLGLEIVHLREWIGAYYTDDLKALLKIEQPPQ